MDLDRKWLIPSLAALAVVLVVAAIIAAMMSRANDNRESEIAENTVEASMVRDFAQVCGEEVTVSNSTSYDDGPTPHKIALFENTLGDEIFNQQSLPSEVAEEWEAKTEAFSEIQLVGCMRIQVDSQELATTCDLQDSDNETIQVELYTATYSITVYEARSGDQLGDPLAVEASDEECPSVATYDPNDPRLFAMPDDEALIDALQPIVEG